MTSTTTTAARQTERPRVVWSPDPRRWNDDPTYRHAVRAFVLTRVLGGSLSDAEVLADAQLGYALHTTSWQNSDGDFNRDATGRIERRDGFIPLDAADL